MCKCAKRGPSTTILCRPVVLKGESLGSLSEEFLIPSRKFVHGRNWGAKAVDEKTLSF